MRRRPGPAGGRRRKRGGEARGGREAGGRGRTRPGPRRRRAAADASGSARRARPEEPGPTEAGGLDAALPAVAGAGRGATRAGLLLLQGALRLSLHALRRASRPAGRAWRRTRLGKRLRAAWRAAGSLPPGLRTRARPAGAVAGLLLLLALFACVRELPPPGASQPTTRASARQGEPRVRVALLEKAPQVTVTLAEAWRLEAEEGGRTEVPPGQLVLRVEGGALVASGAVQAAFPGARSVVLRPAIPAPAGEPAPAFGLGERRYRGELELRPLEGGALLAIDHVGIEDYLAGVLAHEMPIRWADAAVEAQAIASRTYALAELKPGQPYDLKADVRSQVYGGVTPEDERARSIVGRTRGRVLTWKGELITAYFHSTCGGDTVPAPWIFPWEKEEKAPLMGASECRCQPSKKYRWSVTVDLAKPGAVKDLVLELPLREVTLEHWPRGGYVRSMRIVDAGGDVETLSGWDARRAFGLDGYAFEAALAPDGRGITFTGRGWGHGVGLCQWGARGFAEEGRAADEILRHYYPGAQLETHLY